MQFKITLKYQGKEYECDAPCWEEHGYWMSAYEDCGARNCEHDYAALLPKELVKDKEFGCEQKEIEVIDYRYEEELLTTIK